MPYKDDAKHRMLNHLVGNAATGAPITHVSIHSAFPATPGNEIAGVTRVAVTFGAAGGEATGSVDVSNAPAITVPSGATVAALGWWTAATAGTLMADTDITDESYPNGGTLNVSDADLHLNNLNP